MGIAIHSLATAEDHADTSTLDLAAALRQDASGLLGTTVQYAELVNCPFHLVLYRIMRPRRFLNSDNPIFAGHTICGWWIFIHRSSCGFTDVSHKLIPPSRGAPLIT